MSNQPSRTVRRRLGAGVAALVVVATALVSLGASTPVTAGGPPAMARVVPPVAISVVDTRRDVEEVSRSRHRPPPPSPPAPTPTATASPSAPAHTARPAKPSGKSCGPIKNSIWKGACPPPPTKAQVQAIEHEMLAAWGWADQFSCLDKIIELEDHWNVYDENSIHAYGLPQANPGDKMVSEGADWGYNPRTQLRWMLKYIKGRYTTPCNALKIRQSRKPTWY